VAGVRSGVADGGRAGEERIQEPLQFTEPGAVQCAGSMLLLPQSRPSLGDWEKMADSTESTPPTEQRSKRMQTPRGGRALFAAFGLGLGRACRMHDTLTKGWA